jgi:hypothetical protein
MSDQVALTHTNEPKPKRRKSACDDSVSSPSLGPSDLSPEEPCRGSRSSGHEQTPASQPCDESDDVGSSSAPFSRWRMPMSFFHFPAEIRNMIYDTCIQLPGSQTLYQGYNRRVEAYHRRKLDKTSTPDEPFPEFDARISTPTILLLCRAVTTECLPLLREQTWVVDRIPPWPTGYLRPLLISQFIGRRTVQSLKKIEIRLSFGEGTLGSGWVWSSIVMDLLNILLERNSFGSLRVTFSLHSWCHNLSLWQGEFLVIRDILAMVRYAHRLL